jgi:hypothetical protein
MQKFVVGPGIGGAALSWGAAKYLTQMHKPDPLYGTDLAKLACSTASGNDCGIEIAGEDGVIVGVKCSPLLTAWWNEFHSRFPDVPFDGLKDSDEVYMGAWHGNPLRELLVPYLEDLMGSYSRLDSLNNGTELRIAEVPEGYHCGVREDPESGCEVVEEYPRFWHALPDEEYRYVRLVRNFCDSASENPEEFAVQDFVYEVAGLKIALHGDYGMAKCKKSDGEFMYLLLKKNTYYNSSTAEHGKECYDILGDRESKFSLPRLFRGDEEMKAYFSLLKLLEI